MFNYWEIYNTIFLFDYINFKRTVCHAETASRTRPASALVRREPRVRRDGETE